MKVTEFATLAAGLQLLAAIAEFPVVTVLDLQ